MISWKTRFFCSGVLAAAVAGFAPVQAANVASPAVSVRYADLDVATVDGAAVLLERIEAAASDVCARLIPGGLDQVSRAKRLRCARKSIAEAVARVNQPVLAEVYARGLSARRAPSVAALVR
jgi:UrcA family protein